jgi:hypothetical protein
MDTAGKTYQLTLLPDITAASVKKGEALVIASECGKYDYRGYSQTWSEGDRRVFQLSM